MRFLILLFSLIGSLYSKAETLPKDIPLISIKSINDIKLIPAKLPSDPQVGVGVVARYQGLFNGQKVHIRVSDDFKLIDDLINEIRYSRIFTSEGVLVPHYFGVVRLPNDQWGMVSEMVEGTHLGPSPDAKVLLSRKINITEQTLIDTEKAFEVMNRLGIYATDPQFRVRSSDGRAFLIDLEGFQQSDEYNLIQEHAIQQFVRKMLKKIKSCKKLF